MAVQASPNATANNVNQNSAQPLASGPAPLPPVVVSNVQAAPIPTAVLRPGSSGYPVA